MFMHKAPLARTRSRFSDWPTAAKSILGFWCFYALTVVARAFLGTDPWTMLENKLAVTVAGVVLTALIYLAIAGFAASGPISRKVIVAVIGSTIASLVLAVGLTLSDDWFRESKEEMRFHAREGFVVVAKGQTITIERTAQEPLVLTVP